LLADREESVGEWSDWLVAIFAIYGAGLSTSTWLVRRPKRVRQRQGLDLMTILLSPD
jgi:hypothetical protein